MIASDWNSTGPAPSTSAGSNICGLTLRNASSRCLPLRRSMSTTSSGTMPLRLSAMRTRNDASERQNENIFTGCLPCGRWACVFLPGFIAEIVMAASISYYVNDTKEWLPHRRQKGSRREDGMTTVEDARAKKNEKQAAGK